MFDPTTFPYGNLQDYTAPIPPDVAGVADDFCDVDKIAKGIARY